jgi:hypothetical protein
MTLFDGAAERNAGWEKVDRTVDAISRKFGRGKVRKASL